MKAMASAAMVALISISVAAQTPDTSDAGSSRKESDKPDSAPAHRETVVVTGTLQPVPLGEADRSVNAYEVPNRILLLNNLGDVLRLDSSVDLQQRAPGIQGDISIRGGTYGQTLVLIDGVRLNDAQSAHHNFDVPVPLDAISQIEVLRGSGSTFYGSDAIAGVVNVITRVEPLTELRVRGGAGSFGTNVQSGFLSVATSPMSQQFSFERELSTGFQDDRDYRNLAGSYGAQLRTRLGTTAILLSGLDRPFGADQFYGNFNSWERTKTWFSSLLQDLGTNTDLTFSYRRHTDLYELFRDNPDYFVNRHSDDTWFGTIRRHDRLPHTATLFYGGEFLSDSVDSTNLGRHYRNRGALYADLDVRAIKRFSFALGAREEIYGSGQSIFTPSGSGGVWVGDKLKFRGSVSRAFRLPNYTDLYYHDPANLGNPYLKPEEAWNYEGGLDLHPRDQLRLSAVVFQRNVTNGIDYVRQSPTDIWRAMNFAKLHFTGLELLAELKLTSTQQLGMQYTGLHGSQAELANWNSKYVFNYPSHQAIATWQWLASTGLLARTRIGVTDRYGSTPYTVWDLDIAWARKRLRPYLQLTNLLDTSYQEVVNVPTPGRSALAGLEICIICPSR
jgi:iron complex outermembrane receptor protein